MSFVRIVDTALATDGGTVAIILERHDGTRACLAVNRSIGARGSPDYDRVSLDGQVLSSGAAAEALAEVVRLTPFVARLTHPVNKVVRALRRQRRRS